ncbi:hypothetical protein EDD27_8410 [Nonomuraea polychroma]|uniref:Uncharacterized protein n=1 Tax=Nonomuraea polychroma TaxID=46176 RepID=A0A438MJC1_9ACTN|nr:hypothetical protein [Nonomuraea polychroma]RVX45598.1 hypothetical protein EDD27_8410 [Nonomuraea polychroma]
MTVVEPTGHLPAAEPTAPSTAPALPSTPLERRYRRLLLAYPRQYRATHGDELLDVLLESAEPGRSVPALKEAWGLLVGGVRSRVAHQATGNVWVDGLHLAVTAVAAANLAALLPYAGALPVWTLLSALALLAVLRGRVRAAVPLTLAVGVKAVAIASGEQPFDVTLLPVHPSWLADRALFADSSPFAVAAAYAVVLAGLVVLASVPRPALRARSWWWCAAVLAAAWAGPAWMAEETSYPLGLPRMAVEAAAFGLAAAGCYLARDHRWALACGIYLLAASGQLIIHVEQLTRQHLAYWGVLVVLAGWAAVAPFRHRRHCLD